LQGRSAGQGRAANSKHAPSARFETPRGSRAFGRSGSAAALAEAIGGGASSVALGAGGGGVAFGGDRGAAGSIGGGAGPLLHAPSAMRPATPMRKPAMPARYRVEARASPSSRGRAPRADRPILAPMLLTTSRLVLRDFEPEDWEGMLRVEGDAEAVRYQSFSPRTEADCRAYLARDLAARADRSCFDLAVTLDGRLVGRLGLDVKLPERALGELWFILDRSLWGRGLMPEATRRMLDFAFLDLGLRRVFLECDPRNRGAIRLAEKLGMRREGQLREHVFVKGEWCDALYFGVLAGEWQRG
jgi:RimJ/RimL family protein N-acetyltransferase